MSQPASPSARIAGLALVACLAAAAELGPPQEVAFTARHDGSRQAYLELLPQPFDAKARHAVLIALHGHGSDRKQFATDGRAECRAARDAAAARGMIFVAPDYRAPTSWMGPAAEADLVQLIGELKRRHQVGRVVLMGASMGGTSALIFTALHPDLVDGTVALNATANLVEYRGFPDAIAASYGGTREANPKEYRRRSPELAPQAFVRPLACTVGGTDTVVPPDSVRRLAQRLRRDRREVLLIDRPAGGHDTTYEDSAQALAFVLDRVLKGTP
jgi:pimeloyl-ACP methyl ester carboxylesterase